MNDQEKADLIAAGAIGLSLVGAVLYYKRVVRNEKRKRRAIAEWESVGMACIANAKASLREKCKDDSLTIEEVMEAGRIEAAFLDIVVNQPMY